MVGERIRAPGRGNGRLRGADGLGSPHTNPKSSSKDQKSRASAQRRWRGLCHTPLFAKARDGNRDTPEPKCSTGSPDSLQAGPIMRQHHARYDSV
jgi:hypothetical protein